MMHNSGGSRTPPRISLNSSYSYGYSPTSDEPRSFLPSTRHEIVVSPIHDDDAPISPPLAVLTEEYTQTFRLPSAFRGQEEPKIAFDLSSADPMDMHLLLETAMNDSQQYQVLSPDDLDVLKKEESRLARLIEAGKKKLYLESRVDSTSRLLQKLSTNGSNATSPTSPSGSRRSFLRFRTSGSSNVETQSAYGEAGSGSARFQELAKEVWRLEKRQTELQRKKLEHTAGILQYNSYSQTQNGERSSRRLRDGPHLTMNNHGIVEPDLETSLGFDGAMENLEWQTAAQTKVPQINDELHHLLTELEPYDATAQSTPPGVDLKPVVQFNYLESSLKKLSHSHEQLRRLVEESRSIRETNEQEAKESQKALRHLWDVIGASEDGMHSGSRYVDRVEDVSHLSRDELGYGQSFSPQALSSKVQKLCNRATLLSKHQSALTQQLSQEREAHRNSSAARATEQAQAAHQLQEAYKQQLNAQTGFRDIQSKLKATELRLKETQHLVLVTRHECEAKFAEEMAQERNSWKAREHDLSARLASKVTEAGLLMTAISEHEATIAKMQAAEAATISDFDEADTQIEALGANLMAAENRLAKYESAEMDNSKVLNQLMADRERQEAEMALLREEVAKITADLIAAEGHLTTYESAAMENAEKMSALNACKSAEDTKLKKLSTDIATLTNRLQDAEHRLAVEISATHNAMRQVSEITIEKENLKLELNRSSMELSKALKLLQEKENYIMIHDASAQEWSEQNFRLESQRQAIEDTLEQCRKEFSLEKSEKDATLTGKMEELESLTNKHMDLLQDFKELDYKHAESTKTLGSKIQHINQLNMQHKEMSEEMEGLRDSARSDVSERQRLQIQLETSLVSQKHAQDRVVEVERELKDLLYDYEQLVKLEVEAEREREILEQTLEGLRERIEELQVQLDDERVRYMGQRNSGSTNGENVNGSNSDMYAGDVRHSTEGISMGVMRSEFKRMMREARADHYRRLKAEHDEHRRLEEIIRSMQRDRSRSRSSTLLESSRNDVNQK